LELNHVQVRDGFTKRHVFGDVGEESLLLDMENPGAKVWSVMGMLAWSMRLSNLLPVGVAGHRDEDVRFPKLCSEGHGILVLLVHVPRPPREG
jgi:hypothetical protein